jgi:hypothetical protein
VAAGFEVTAFLSINCLKRLHLQYRSSREQD